MRLDLRDFGRQFGDALKHVQAELGMAHLAAAEAHGHLHLVAFAEEVEDLLHLHVEIMIVNVRTHLDLFDFLRLLALAREVRLFLRLIFELADVEEFAHRRIGVRRYFHQVEPDPGRSEEHTSELQSLMRISYAVFCLKKKKHTKSLPTIIYYTLYTNMYTYN